MAAGAASATAQSELGAIANATNFTAFAAVWIQLHTASPGAAGTTAVAANNVRKQATFAAASGGSVSNSVAILWSAVSTTETYTFFTAWTASTAGTFEFSGTVTGGAVTAGNDFNIAIGSLSLSLAVAS